MTPHRGAQRGSRGVPNPLGCGSRTLENGFCQEKAAVYRACRYRIGSSTIHQFGRDPYNGGSMPSWYDDGESVATTTIDVRARTMTLRAPYCEVVMPLMDYLDLGKQGPKSALPPALQ